MGFINSYTGIETNSRKIVDDSLKANATNATGVGLEVRVSRQYDGVGLSRGRSCQFCLDRVCTNVTLAEAYDIGVFQRHDGCGCLIEYTSKRGERTYQTGKSGRNDWISMEELERRMAYGLDERKVTPQERIINAAIEMQVRDKKSLTLVNAILENHDALKHYTPQDMLTRLQRAGHKVEPLSKGSLKGVPFKDNGGFKINFGGDGLFQYHPQRHSHHEGKAYWKIKKEGVSFHYDMAGNEIKSANNFGAAI